MAVDTSRDAVERLALRMEGIARQTTVYASLDRAHAGDAAATLRALLARAEAAEARSDEAHRALIVEVKRTEAFRAENTDLTTQRDAATAERDRLAEVLRKIESMAHLGDRTAESLLYDAVTLARAVLKKEPTDGE